MLLTVLTIVFFIICYRLNKKGRQIRYFLPLFTFLLSTYLLAIIPVNFMIGWLIGVIMPGVSVIFALLYRFVKLKLPPQRMIKVLLFAIITISLYTQLFNGIETFYYNPVKYFQYSLDITHRYYYIPPKIISIKGKGEDYVYSLTQYKNSFLFPESMTRIEIYKGRACYYWAKWSLGDLAYLYRRYFYNNAFIDSPV